MHPSIMDDMNWVILDPKIQVVFGVTVSIKSLIGL